MSTIEQELLPCPFCGEAPSTGERQDESLWSHARVTWYKVFCRHCDFFFDSEKEGEAVRRWNNREVPGPSDLQQQLDAANQRIKTLEAELDESKAETASCLHFLDTEIGWEWFRVEYQLGSKKAVSQSEENAEKLTAYLGEKGHGLRYRKAAERKLATIQTDLRELKQSANRIFRNQQMSTLSVATGLLQLVGAYVDEALAQIEQPQAPSSAPTPRKCWSCGSSKDPCYDRGTLWCADCGVSNEGPAVTP